MSEKPSNVRSLLISIQGGRLLLPTAVVAEVTPYKKVVNANHKTIGTMPPWLLGIIEWREQLIPLISIEKILSLPLAPLTTESHVIVLYGLEFIQVTPFYAFVAATIPHVLSVSDQDLTAHREIKRNGLVFSAKLTDKETVFLPDVNFFENLLRKSQVAAQLFLSKK